MTWTSVYGGAMSISEKEPAVNFIEATSEYLDIYFSSIGDLVPCMQDFTVYVNGTAVNKSGIYYDGFETVRIYFDYTIPDGTTGSVPVSFSYSYSSETASFSIAKDKYKTYFTV